MSNAPSLVLFAPRILCCRSAIRGSDYVRGRFHKCNYFRRIPNGSVKVSLTRISEESFELNSSLLITGYILIRVYFFTQIGNGTLITDACSFM